MYINKAIVVGNITRKPELRTLPSGSTTADVGVATNRTWKDQNGEKKESTEFHNVVAYGRQAELAAQYLGKGQSVAVEGRLETRSWEKDGVAHYRTEIIAERVQFGPKSAKAAGADIPDG